MTRKTALAAQQTTSKKVKYAGTQNFINTSTGEIVEMHVNEITDRDFNFSKVWMRNFIATLDLVGNKKTKFCFWLIDHLDRENKISLSYRQMADGADVSYQTVAVTMSVLQDADFLRRLGTAYVINPDVIFKGTRTARMAVLNDYQAAERVPMSREQKIKMINASIRELEEQKKTLEAEGQEIVAEVEGQLAFSEEMQIVERATPITKR